MIRGPDYIYKCPTCKNLIARGSLISGNRFDSQLYSDGKIISNMLPEFPSITKCHSCNEIFWIGKLEKIDEKSDENPAKYENVKHCTFLSVYDYIKALDDRMYNSDDEELFLCLRIQWGFNDRVRNGHDLFSKNLDFHYWERNIYRLLYLLDDNEESLLLTAELHRNLGDFKKCIKSLYTIKSNQSNEDLKWRKLKIVENCKAKNRLVFDFYYEKERYSNNNKKSYYIPKSRKRKYFENLQTTEQNELSKSFNKGFCLINGFINNNIDYLSNLEFTKSFRKDNRFDYAASSLEDYKKAILLFTEMISIEPDYAISYEFRGIAKYQSNIFEDAIEDYSQAIALDCSFERLYYLRGLTKEALKDFEGAIDDYTKAIELDADYAEAYINRGCIKQVLADSKDAIEDFTKVINIDTVYAQSNYNRAYYNRGIAKASLKNYNGAISDYTLAIKIKPNDCNPFINRGIAKKKQKDYSGAIEDYNKAIEINPALANVYINRGLVKKELCNYKEAITDYNKAIILEPNNELAFRHRGDAEFELHNYQNAIVDYSLSIDFEPTNALSYYSRCLAKHKLEDYSGAQNDYDIGEGLDPKKSSYYSYLFFDESEPDIDKESLSEEDEEYQWYLDKRENDNFAEEGMREAFGIDDDGGDISDWLEVNGY